MFRSYLNIALRTLARHKGYTFINVTGLAVGMACCLLILLYVRDEVSYDRFHDDADRIYRIVSDWDGGQFVIPSTNPPTVKRLEEDYPDIPIARIIRNQALVTYQDRSFLEERILFTRPTFFDVFSFRLLQGDPETVLEAPFTVLLTPETARKYFGDADPIGQTLRFDTEMEAEVVGLVEPAPEHAHFHYDMLVSWATLDALFDYSNSMSWGNNSIYTYFLLPEGYAPAQLEAQFPDFIERHAGEDWNGSVLSLQALTDIHLHSNLNMEMEPNSNIAYVYIFSVVALFILLVACINFMNLATARSAERAREVGVRKVMGAHRGQLIQQFLAESTVLSVFALLLAVALTVMALPAFRSLSGKMVTIDVLQDGFTMGAFLAIALVVGILAGSYPAFVLSAFQPVAVLKGKLARSRRGVALRKGLVVFQFATSIFLIVGTVVVYNQLDYLRNANLGFDKEQVAVIQLPDRDLSAQYQPFKQALARDADVLAVSIASEGLPSELLNGSGTRLDGLPEDDQERFVPTRTVAVGHGFFEALGVEMAAGRSFSLDFPADSSAYILNATAARLLQATAPERLAVANDVVGQQVRSRRGLGEVVGVVEDFNMSSLHEAIEPIIFFFEPGWYDHFLVRVNTRNVSETVAFIEDTWASLYPDWPLAFSFADAAFDAQYRNEDRLGQVFSLFSFLAILIACLGLFGLASFTATQRTKEIGVRKVMGASVPQIIVMLSREFTVLVLVALVVATPIAYLVMDRWLDGFAYRTDVGAGVFLLAGALALGIAWLTVSYQSVKAALSNPVEALRYE